MRPPRPLAAVSFALVLSLSLAGCDDPAGPANAELADRFAGLEREAQVQGDFMRRGALGIAGRMLRHGALVQTVTIVEDGQPRPYRAVVSHFAVDLDLPDGAFELPSRVIMAAWRGERAERLLIVSVEEGEGDFSILPDPNVPFRPPPYFAHLYVPADRRSLGVADQGSVESALLGSGGECELTRRATPRANVTCERATISLGFDMSVELRQLLPNNEATTTGGRVQLTLATRALRGVRFVWRGCAGEGGAEGPISCVATFPAD